MKLATIILAVTVFFFSATAHAEDWDKTEKIMLGTFVAGQIINFGQTNKVINDPQWHEVNRFMPADTTEELILWKAGTTALVALVADQLSHKNRKIVLGVANTIVFGFVAHDLYVGVGFKF
jgi:glucose uptake protein GlcU